MTMSGSPEQPDQDQPQGVHVSRGPLGIPTRWLIIGGGGILLLVVAVLAVVMSGIIGGGNPQPRSLYDLIPEDAYSVVIMDVERILAIDDLADAMWTEQEWDDAGIDSEDVSEMAVVERDGVHIVMMAGDFDLDDIRDELEDEDAEKDSYRGYEVWRGADGSGALFDGYTVVSEATRPVENILKNLYNGTGSLGKADDDNEMKQILDQVGGGLVVSGVTGDACSVERCEGYGWAMVDHDESAGETEIKIALLFRNERAAERAADDYDQVADFLEREGFDIEDTEADGSFVTGVAVRDADDGASGSGVSREDWIEDCDRNSPSPDADRYVCSCIYDHLEENVGRVPEYDPRWDIGFAPPDVVRAGLQCY